MPARLQARLIAHGALVFALGLLAGFPFGFLILGRISLWPIPGALTVSLPGDLRAWRMAHLEGILNGLVLFAVAGLGPRLVLSEAQHARLTWLLVITAWGNVIASCIGPLFGGRGLEFGGSVANSLMYLLFVVAVVAVLWAMVLIYRGARAMARG